MVIITIPFDKPNLTLFLKTIVVLKKYMIKWTLELILYEKIALKYALYCERQ